MFRSVDDHLERTFGGYLGVIFSYTTGGQSAILNAGLETCPKVEGQMRRREFITILGDAAVWRLAARAQTAATVVGFIDGVSVRVGR
jgi:hypothetical protein